MGWLSENWVFLLTAIAFIALHIFMHAGHGGHGSHGGGYRDQDPEGEDRDKRRAGSTAHRH
ncbi:MAG TPA: DUF2933 domain-containing protein [Burkholderiales bacterium]|nr:DUF2933 domain-containing protein [Burkholderiales bacterium]